MSYGNFLKADLPFFHQLLRKIATQWGKQKAS